MTVFMSRDKKPISTGRKWLTFRPLTHKEKGGKRYCFMCERVRGGFGSGNLSTPYFFDLRFMDDYWAKALGFENVQEYLNEPYNKTNGDYLRKAYIISDFIPNEKGGDF